MYSYTSGVYLSLSLALFPLSGTVFIFRMYAGTGVRYTRYRMTVFISFIYLLILVHWWWLEAVLLGIIPSPVTTSVVIVLVSPGLFCNSRVLHPLRSLVLVMQLCVFVLRVEPIFYFIIYLCRALWGSCQDLSSGYALDTCPRGRSLETWRLPVHSLMVTRAIPGIYFKSEELCILYAYLFII